jgi:archaemetzincin
MGLWGLKPEGSEQDAAYNDLRISWRRIILLMLLYTLVFLTGLWLGGLLRGPQLTQRVFTRDEGQDFYLPVSSRMLTVAIQPLVPREAANGGQQSGAAAMTAQELMSAGELTALAVALEQLYPFNYTVLPPLVIPEGMFHADRQQYDAQKLLEWMIGESQPQYFRTAAVLSQDIYKPEMNFLFGLARIGGNCCVSSCARMGGEVDGPRLTPEQRWASIVRHELGHTLGLQHVDDRKSVMAYGDSLEALDRQGDMLTTEDWQELRRLHPIRWDRQSKK